MRARSMGMPAFTDMFRDLEKDIGSVIGTTCRRAVGYGSSVDIHEDDDGYTLWFDVPGVDKKDIRVEVEEGTLSVRGQRSIKDEGIYQERTSGEFSRSFKLPENVGREDVSAKLENGVLKIRLLKSPEAKPIKIDIN